MSQSYVTFLAVFGFAQDTLTAPERGEPYTVEFGFFSGVARDTIDLNFTLSLGTAGTHIHYCSAVHHIHTVLHYHWPASTVMYCICNDP